MSEARPPRSHFQGLVVHLDGETAYDPAWRLQQRLAALREALELPDVLLLLEHEPVVTVGRRGRAEHVLTRDCPVVPIDRGGDVTYHGPGQLTGYWISDLQAHDLGVHAFVHALEESLIVALSRFGILGERRAGLTGVWVRARDGDAPAGRSEGCPPGEAASEIRWAKIAAIGVRIARHVSTHGIALNVGRQALAGFRGIVPCGLAGEAVTAIEALPGGSGVGREAVAEALAAAFAACFETDLRPLRNPAIRSDADADELVARLRVEARRGARKPAWLRMNLPGGEGYGEVRRVLSEGGLHTVCESARCPNCHECWNDRTATFLILGTRCTRDCRFCAIDHAARPPAPAADEPAQVARAVARLGLRHAVVTSVTRDDLPDGGAGHFAAIIEAIRAVRPETAVEVLIPDFGGDAGALSLVLAARPDVLNHNVETVARLYPRVRAGADYRRSLGVLAAAAAAGLAAKSGFMIGLGESMREVRALLDDLRDAGCDRVTIGQYLRPGPRQVPVQRYYTPEEFEALAEEARAGGFVQVRAGPLVRSSYRAARL